MVAIVPQEIETPMAFTVEEVVGMGRGLARSRWAGAPSARDRRAIERALAYTDTADLRRREVRRHLLAGNYVAACNALLKYKYAAGFDCSTPGNRICSGVWTRQLKRHAKCMAAQS